MLARGGCHPALTELRRPVSERRRPVRAPFCPRPADSDDARQEAALAVLLAARRYEPGPVPFEGYAGACGRYALAGWRREGRLDGLRPRSGPDVPRVEGAGFDVPGHETETDSEPGPPLTPAVATLLGRLRPGLRQVVEPLFVDGLTVAEAAARLGVTVWAARELRTRAMYFLRRRIGRPAAGARP